MSTAKHIYIPRASGAWKLLMQSGVGLSVTVGIPLSDFFTGELALSEEQQKIIEAMVLNGMPVDDPSAAVIEDNSRLALAAGLPGIAGLAMKKNSAVRALRGGITHRGLEHVDPKAGRVTLALYSLVLPALGGHFLQRGITISHAQFRLYAQFAPGDFCEFEGRRLSVADLLAELSALPETEEFLFTAIEAEAAGD